MKKIDAFIKHIRSAAFVDHLRDSGFKYITLLHVKGTLEPLNASEQDYSTVAGVVTSEVRISLVSEDSQVDEVANIISELGQIGPDLSG